MMANSVALSISQDSEVRDSERSVVNFHHWLSIASFIANSSNVCTRGNEHEQRECIMHNLLTQNSMSG